MWAIDNRTLYAAERNWYLDKNASKSWVVAVKAAFDILPDGSTQVAADQEEPLYGPEYEGEPGKSAIKYEADLAGPKKNTDVILTGHAYTPHGKPAPKVGVEMAVGNICKQAVVFGDRHWRNGIFGLSMSKPEPFVRMPLVPERAFGGWDTQPQDLSEHRLYPSNPIGTGFAVKAEHLDGSLAPNVEYMSERIFSWKDRPRPAIFRPVASYWSPRLEYAGTYDDKWMKERLPLLAEDFDERYYQVAPEDQQTKGFLLGGERVQLKNLTPSGYLTFTLPKVWLMFTTHFGREQVEHSAQLHTVILEPDRPRVILVWCTLLPCHHKVDKLDSTVIREKPFNEEDWPCC